VAGFPGGGDRGAIVGKGSPRGGIGAAGETNHRCGELGQGGRRDQLPGGAEPGRGGVVAEIAADLVGVRPGQRIGSIRRGDAGADATDECEAGDKSALPEVSGDDAGNRKSADSRSTVNYASLMGAGAIITRFIVGSSSPEQDRGLAHVRNTSNPPVERAKLFTRQRFRGAAKSLNLDGGNHQDRETSPVGFRERRPARYLSRCRAGVSRYRGERWSGRSARDGDARRGRGASIDESLDRRSTKAGYPAPEKGSQSTMEPSSPDALHPGESSESQALYHSQVTLGLSSWQPVPRFARLTALLVGVFQKTPGAVKLTFSVAPGRRQFTSHSVWRDNDAAQKFFKSPEHREAIKRAYAPAGSSSAHALSVRPAQS
jgi:hypothetical protein